MLLIICNLLAIQRKQRILISSMTLVKQKIRFIQRSQIVVTAILGPRRFHDIRGNMYVSNPPYILEKDFENYPLKISFNR